MLSGVICLLYRNCWFVSVKAFTDQTAVRGQSSGDVGAAALPPVVRLSNLLVRDGWKGGAYFLT